MSKKGIILRLVDVVLILLFGFISISEVSRKSKIELAKTTEFPVEKLENEEIVIVGITPDGKFLVADEAIMIDNLTLLKQYILTKKREFNTQNSRMRIRIRSNWDTPIKYTLWISELCDKIGVTKGVDVERRENK